MNDQELRAMIRESIARHSGGAADASRLAPDAAIAGAHAHSAATHASFARLLLLRSGDEDGMCLIEPAVRCNHCGYCQSFGH